MKNGLIQENGTWIYYKDDMPYHAGVIKHGDDIYYITSRGHVVTGEHVVHTSMANGILKRGIYTFGEDGRLIENSYRPPEKRKDHTHRNHHRKSKGPLSKTQLRAILSVSCAVCLLLAVVVIALVEKSAFTPHENTLQDGDATLVMPTFTSDVYLCTAYAAQVCAGDVTTEKAYKSGDPHCAFSFPYQLTDTSGVLRISENSDMTDCLEFVMDKKETAVTVDNLKTGTTYYYKATVGDQEFVGSFHTASTTRFLTIPSLRNVRDIGGYQTESGRTVKQAMLIRGPEIDGLINPDYFIPVDKIAAVQETFGFAHELDLRAPTTYTGTYQSRFGSDVSHRFYNSPSYGGIFNPENSGIIRSIFSDLANPNLYPMYMHCTWGADRTGTIAFLVLGMLGVSEDDMILDYNLSDFAVSGFSQRENLEPLIWGLNVYEGDTLQEKIVSYLMSVGVTESEIASIRSILLT